MLKIRKQQDTIKSQKKAEKFWDMLSDKTDKVAGKFEQMYSKSIEKTGKYLSSDNTVLDLPLHSRSLSTSA